MHQQKFFPAGTPFKITSAVSEIQVNLIGARGQLHNSKIKRLHELRDRRALEEFKPCATHSSPFVAFRYHSGGFCLTTRSGISAVYGR
ncbi:MAG: hypothetical protein WKF30_17170 [Pyrinomonadaceae bacterium]